MAAKKYSPEEIENLKWENLITSRNLLKYNNKCHRKSQIDKLPDELRKSVFYN